MFLHLQNSAIIQFLIGIFETVECYKGLGSIHTMQYHTKVEYFEITDRAHEFSENALLRVMMFAYTRCDSHHI